MRRIHGPNNTRKACNLSSGNLAMTKKQHIYRYRSVITGRYLSRRVQERVR